MATNNLSVAFPVSSFNSQVAGAPILTNTPQPVNSTLIPAIILAVKAQPPYVTLIQDGVVVAVGLEAAGQTPSAGTTAGTPGGYATLDTSGEVTPNQLPWVMTPSFSKSNDPVVEANLAKLKGFTDWLTAKGVKGELGEVGIPLTAGNVPDQRWLSAAEALMEAADVAHLDLFYWAAAANEWGASNRAVQSPQGWPNLVVPGQPYDDLGQVNPQFGVLAGHLTVPAAGSGYCRRGIALATSLNNSPTGATAAGTTFPFSNARETVISYLGNTYTTAFGFKGTYVQYAANPWNVGSFLYNYGSLADYQLLAAIGIRTVRLPIRWERVQRSMLGVLDATEMARIDQAISWANQCDIRITIDLHNFGCYFLDNGTTGVAQVVSSTVAANLIPIANLTDVWTKLSAHFKAAVAAKSYGTSPLGVTNPIEGYELMDEPGNMTQADWITASQAIVTAIRTTNTDTAPCLIIDMGGGGNYSNPSNIGLFNAQADWIGAGRDATLNYRYKMDHYIDIGEGGSGAYSQTYDAELLADVAAGHLGVGYPIKSIASTAAGSVGIVAVAYTTVTTTGGTPWTPAVTFVAPRSGAVELELDVDYSFTSPTALATADLQLTSTAGGGPNKAVNICTLANAAGVQTGTVSRRVLITGLTPGTTYTYTLQARVSSGTLTVYGANTATNAQGQLKASPALSGALAGA